MKTQTSLPVDSAATSVSAWKEEEFSPDALPKEKVGTVGTGYVSNIWYFAVPSSKLKAGQMVTKTIIGEPIVLGRDENGKPFALKDICPHQAVPLSDGRFNGKHLECPFHGWKFNTSGVCESIPALCNDQKLNLCAIKTRTYPCREELDSVWVFMGDQVDELPQIPRAPGLAGYSYGKTTTTLHLPNHIDYNVVALIDTAHVPYVHNAWWWRSSRTPHEKKKTYVPTETGWTMLRHQPRGDSILFKLFGRFIETEIGFRLPGCRIEHIQFGGRTIISGITALTPIDDNNTELNHTTYWTLPWISPFVTPLINYLVKEFLSQDRRIALRQSLRLKGNPQLSVTVGDSGMPGRWYFFLKKEWNESRAKKRPFVNPIKETTLRWRT